MELIKDFNKAKHYLRVRLYNEKTHVEIRRSAAEYGFSDLVLIPYLEGIVKDGAIRVTQGLLENWDVTEEEVFTAALDNTAREITVTPLDDALARLTGGDPGEFAGGPQMVIVSNVHNFYGASAALFTKGKLKEIFPDGYYILPSSVHEVIAIPKEAGADSMELASMIGEVNATQVDVTEQLGNHPYAF